jgi:transcriptional regulator
MARHDLMPGTLDMLVLKTLQPGERHGYAIAQRIHDWSGDVLSVEEGALYPALHRMEERGWIKGTWKISETGRQAKVYRLTPAGRRRLDEAAADWKRLSAAVGRVMEAF